VKERAACDNVDSYGAAVAVQAAKEERAKKAEEEAPRQGRAHGTYMYRTCTGEYTYIRVRMLRSGADRMQSA